ncbi:acyl carrier protein [Streptomyces sp. NPDC057638]|uniref:acyl carrier protein n=1 Tax=Streptomyces sp. NPDC057638 TaxID=3346190 RepID=UPI003687CBC6
MTVSATAPVSTTAPTGPATVRAELLDCVQSSLAVLADRHHGPGAHLALGATVRFTPRPGPHGLPTIEPDPLAQLAAAGELGLVERARWNEVTPGELALLAQEHGTLYVLADTYAMSWLPYHGRRHMEHSYLVAPMGTRAVVTDAYHSHTPWGLASPGEWLLDWAELPVSSLVIAFEPAPEAGRPASGTDHGGDIAAYVTAYADHPDRTAAIGRLATETWLLARQRRLYGAHLEREGSAAPAELAEHLRRLDRLAEQTFLALRRLERGRPESRRLLDDLAAALHADRRILTALDDDAPMAPPEGAGLRTVVTATVASVLAVDTAEVEAAPALTDLPGFSSFQVVEIVEALEERLGVEFAADDLVPENLHHVDALCRLAAEATGPR